jgi:valyl-tRNA synthetase
MMTTPKQPSPTTQPPASGLAKAFEPAAIERHWYPVWEARGYFAAGLDPARPSFSIQLPPPNVTGILHMGHAFNQSIMDALTRYHRMRGFNTLWLPGTDHAGIATQIVVERQLEASGVDRKTIGREAFNKHVWDWKEYSGGAILGQMRRLGDSVDWNRTYFTMDDKLSKVVVETFVRLYEQGSSIAASASSTGTRSCRPRCRIWRSRARRKTAGYGRSAIRAVTAAKA